MHIVKCMHTVKFLWNSCTEIEFYWF